MTEEVLRKASLRLKFAAANRGYYEVLLDRADALAEKIPAERRGFYQAHVLTAAGVNLHSNEMLEHFCQALRSLGSGDRAGALHNLERALAATNDLFASLRLGERGKWAGWYIGEGLVGIEQGRDLIRLCLAALQGEPPPPIRTSRDYPQFYQYQERFNQNFPLLYGSRPVCSTTPALDCHVTKPRLSRL